MLSKISGIRAQTPCWCYACFRDAIQVMNQIDQVEHLC